MGYPGALAPRIGANNTMDTSTPGHGVVQLLVPALID
jgi:hypothetical protein